MNKTYVLAFVDSDNINKDVQDEIELIRVLRGRLDASATMEHAGKYNEYVFLFASLSDEDVLFLSLWFGPKLHIMESKGESYNDLIVRIFNAGHKSRLQS